MTAATSSLASLSVGFIGAGRLGAALALALQQAGVPVRGIASATPASAERVAAAVPGSAAMGAQQLAQACDVVFITTPDAAIEATSAALRWRAGQAVVHCSGATEVSALAAARQQGAAIGGFHPLQAFGPDAKAAATSLAGCTITIEAEDPALDARLLTLAQSLGCAVNRLPPGMRARYHAAAGYGSQFINVLFAEAARVWASWGASEADVVRALLPMARGALASMASAGIAKGMPGPVSRGDLHTVAQHVAALQGSATLPSYLMHCNATVDLALQAGAIDPSKATELRQVLAGAAGLPPAG
jgi:predicted short-subunit dehydrogenase-like oxidoreductase (DUF2520 family)